MIRHNPTPRQVHEEFGFMGGVNMSGMSTELPRGQMRNCVNLILDESGALSLRNGSDFISPQITGVGTITILGQGRFTNSLGTTYRICAYKDSNDSLVHFKYLNTTWQEITQASGISFTNSISIRFCMAGDLLLIFNGQDRICCWDGSHHIIYLGVTAPPTAPTLAAGTSTLTEGYYWYMIAYKNNDYGFLSSASAVASRYNTGGAGIKVTIPLNLTIDPEVGYSGSVGAKIYRSTRQTTADQPPWSAFYYLTQVVYDGNPAVDYNDTVDDGVLTTQGSFLSEFATGRYDHDLPDPKATRCAFHKSRLFLITGTVTLANNVFFSKTSEPAYFPLGQDFEVDPGVGMPLNQISTTENGVFLFKESGANILETYGQPAQWKIRKISTKGCLAPDTVRVIQSFSGEMSTIRLTMSGVSQITEGGDIDVSKNINSLFTNIPSNELKNFTACYLERQQLYIIFSHDYTLFSSAPDIGIYLVTPQQGINPLENELSGNEGALMIGVKGMIFDLRKRCADLEGNFLGYATTFHSKGYKYILDDINSTDEQVYGVGDEPNKLMKIWFGKQDVGSSGTLLDMPFHFTTRPISPDSKLQNSRFKNFYIRFRASDCIFDAHFDLDFGVVNQIYPAISGLVSATHFDQNIFSQLDPATYSALITGALADGSYYLAYALTDTADWNTAVLKTQASHTSTAMVVTGGPKGIRFELPGDKTAYDKGYRYYQVFYGGPLASAPNFSDMTHVNSYSLDSGGTNLTVDWNGTLSGNVYALSDPPAVLLWSATPGMANVKQSLTSRMVGNYATITILGYSGDPFLSFMGIGLSYKPKSLR